MMKVLNDEKLHVLKTGENMSQYSLCLIYKQFFTSLLYTLSKNIN